MNELTISFEARCSTCGDPLEVERVTEGPHPHVPVIVVAPCERCIETASDKKAEEAHDEAYEGVDAVQNKLDEAIEAWKALAVKHEQIKVKLRELCG